MDNLLDKRKLLEQELVRYSVLKGNIDNFILDINNNLNEINDEIFEKQFDGEPELIVLDWSKSGYNKVEDVVNKVVVTQKYKSWKKSQNFYVKRPSPLCV